MNRANNKGFSLVELIVVIAIMAILAAVAIPTFAGFIRKANEASDIQYMHDVEYAIRLAFAHDPTVEFTGFVAHVNPNTGYVEDVTYTIRGALGPDGEYADREFSHKEGNGDNASPIIDWEYSFKAADTVASNPNWLAHWGIVETEDDGLGDHH